MTKNEGTGKPSVKEEGLGQEGQFPTLCKWKGARAKPVLITTASLWKCLPGYH